ncbi:MAG: hypothetical protein U0176_04365 [Bacteroidia bacterium]
MTAEKHAWHPTDGGPHYAETPTMIEFGQWLMEPWNAISSLLIVAPAIYFLWRLRGRFSENIILTACIPLLAAGGMGSTLFHGLRSSRFLLMLDVWPTMVLFLLITLYFWAKAYRNWWAAAATMVAGFALPFWVYTGFKGSFAINLGYAVRGTLFFLPLVVLLFRTRFKGAGYVLFGLLAFGAALLFRTTDKQFTDILPMGTHFLWHSFTGIGGFLIAEYLLRTNAATASKTTILQAG